MQVQEIWRYPVKSMQGERTQSAAVGPFGIVGDRGWALFDAETGVHLTARRCPQLLYAAARVLGTDSPTAELEVMVTLPDGTETADDAALSDWLGTAVELRRADPGSVGTYEIQLDEADDGSWIQWNGPAGSFHDSTRSQLSLASVPAFGDWDRRRFRTNLIVDQPGEEALVGQQVTIGSSRIDVTKQIDRCVMVTRPQPAHEDSPALERDLSVLTTINAVRDTFLSVGAMVVEAGQITVGDHVIVGPGDQGG
jgi:uncharacterized protein YcbX